MSISLLFSKDVIPYSFVKISFKGRIKTPNYKDFSVTLKKNL